MNVVAQVFAVLVGVLHILFFVLESVLFRRPAAHRIFGVRSADVETVRLWAFNQGFYNLFLAAGALLGVLLLNVGDETAGATLVVFTCASALAASLVLLASDPSVARLRGVLLQGGPALVALLAALF